MHVDGDFCRMDPSEMASALFGLIHAALYSGIIPVVFRFKSRVRTKP